MKKKYSAKFWMVFLLCATLLLGSFFYYWYGDDFSGIDMVANLLPINIENKKQLEVATKLYNYFEGADQGEKTFLILFQNNMELRPGGGYIGTFGILKMNKGSIVEMETHDLSNFDGRIPDTVSVPYPMEETLHIKSWKMRDSNFSPDFKTNAKKAEEFYHMGKGEESFDGVIGITADVLTSFLEVVGPVSIEGYPGTYDSESAILNLEYQVEKAFGEQGIAHGDRKSIMKPLAEEIMKKAKAADWKDKLRLVEKVVEDLNQKDIQLYFKDAALQSSIDQVGWSGDVNQEWKNDYLMAVDANLGAYKSDYYIKREYEYWIDFSKEKAEAKFKITYNHTAKQKDWMTNNYVSYLRLYVPKGSWLFSSQNLGDVKFGDELEKSFFGSLIFVPIGQIKTFEFSYYLPENIDPNNYELLMQKQAGIKNIPTKIHLIYPDGKKKDSEIILNSDYLVQ